MVHYLNDTEAWNRQDERYLLGVKSGPAVHPGVALSKYARPGSAPGAAARAASASGVREAALSAAR
jgi:hypothetical protein